VGIRNILLGNPQGKTAWQRLRDGWKKDRELENYERAFARASNPLRLKPGDLVELGFEDRRSYTVETVLWFHTPTEDPDYTRYGMKDLETGHLALLEVLPGESGRLLYALFELVDEIDLDLDLLAVLEDEDTLRHTVETDEGETLEVDYEKDFATQAELSVFAKEELTKVQVLSFNYCIETEGGEQYLSVEVVEEAEAMNFYRGRKLDETDVVAMGTVVTT
jgi:hypothetical protein